MPNPTIASAMLTPSGQLLYVVPLKADGTSALNAISAVAASATLTVDGVDVPLGPPMWSSGWSGVAFPVCPARVFTDATETDGSYTDTSTAVVHTAGGAELFDNIDAWAGHFKTYSDPAATATFTLATPRQGRYLLGAYIRDLCDSDRTTRQIFTAKDGTGKVIGTWELDLTTPPPAGQEHAANGMPLTTLGYLTVDPGQDSITVTISNGAGSGLLVANLLVMTSAFIVTGAEMSATFDAGTVTVSGVGTDAATLAVTQATDADFFAPIHAPADRTLKIGYNLDFVREDSYAISLADRGFGSDKWAGSCTLDEHYEMVACTGTVTRRLLFGSSGDGLTTAGRYLMADGRIKIEATYSGATFDAAARANITLTGGWDTTLVGWTDLGGGRWRVEFDVARKPWVPISQRTELYSHLWTSDLGFQSANAGLLITGWQWFDGDTPAGYTGTAHPKHVAALKGWVETIRSMDVLGTNGSVACLVGDFITPADRRPPDSADSVNYQIFTINVLSIRPVDLDPGTDADQFYRYFDLNGQVGWVVATVDDASPLIGRDANFCGIAGGTTSAFTSTVAGIQVSMTAALNAIYLDATHVLLCVHVSNSYSTSPTPQRATVDQAYDTPGMILGISKPNAMALETFLDYCSDLDAAPWVNVPHAATDALVDWMADTTIAGTPDGRKVYVEYSNEHWNTGFVQISYFDVMYRHANWLNGQDSVANPYTYPGPDAWFGIKAIRVADRFRARMTNAGRDPELIVCVVGSLTANAGVTEQIVLQAFAEGGPTARRIDAIAIESYQDYSPQGSDLAGSDLADTWSRLDAGGNIDVLAISSFYGTRAPIDALHIQVKHDHGYEGSAIVRYEGGPAYVCPAFESPDPSQMRAPELISDPRMYRYIAAVESYLQDRGTSVDVRYKLESDFESNSSDGGKSHAWTEHYTPMPAMGTGAATENPSWVDYPNVKGQLVAGRKDFATGFDFDATTVVVVTTDDDDARRRRNRLSPQRRRKLIANFRLPPRTRK